MFFVYGAHNSNATDKAEFILYSFGLEYKLFLYGKHYTLRQIERLLPGVKSVPQIFHGAKHIGGLRELHQYLIDDGITDNGKREQEGSKKIFTLAPEDKPSEGDFSQS